MADKPNTIVWFRKGLRTRYRPEAPILRGLIGAAPWLNAALLVVMFLWLTFPYVQQPGVVVQLPEAPFASGTPYGHRLAILSQESQEAGTREEIVYFDDEPFLVRDPARMATLRDSLRRAATDRPKAPLIIEADKRVLHGTILDILNMAGGVGMKEINIATRPPR